MLFRLSSALASFLALTACAAEPSAPTDPFVPPRDEVPRWPVGLHLPVGDDDKEPSRCVDLDHGITQLGTTGHDELRDVVVTPTGTIFVAGFENGTLTPHGMWGSRGVVHAYTEGLDQLALHAMLDTTGTDAFESLALAPATGTVWFAARTDGALPDLQSRGGYDVVLGDLRSTGGFRPLARGFDSTTERVRQLAIAPDGYLAVAGHEERLTLEHGMRLNPFLSTYTTSNAAMSQLWYTTRRTAFNERFDAVDVSDTMIVVGGSIDEGEEQGMFVATYSRDADLGWRRRLPDFGVQLVTAVKLLPDGNVVWLGSTRNEPYGATDIVIGVLDGATGTPLWTKEYGGTSEDHARDLVVDAAGRIHIVGASAVNESTDLDAFLLVLEATGEPVLEERWGSGGTDIATAVALDGCDAIVITGWTDGDLGGPSRGGRDGFVIVTRIAP